MGLSNSLLTTYVSLTSNFSWKLTLTLHNISLKQSDERARFLLRSIF